MLWLVFDARLGQELMLCMPRLAPNSAAATEHWLKLANASSRIQHPHLAHVIEVGQVEQWPYLAYDRALGETLDERLARLNVPLPLDAADWIGQYLQGLAFAHEAGHVHRDVQCASMIISASNQVRVLGLEVAQEVFPATSDFNTVTRRAVRESAEEDVLCVGLLLNRILSGRPVLEQTDLQAVIQQMQPQGHELVRMGWETPHPTPEPLRAICNRATSAQPRQRYHSARSFLRAIEGWRSAAATNGGGPITLLLDRLQRVGHLPSSSASVNRIGLAAQMAGQHTSVLSALVLQDMALSLELLRRVNNALKQSGSTIDGSILNLQRAIALLGLDGVQQAARALKPWPGPLSEPQAALLHGLMLRVQRAGQMAQALRPAGYDAEVVYLITVMQNLGRLLLQYHFPDDAQQIRQLMQPPEPTADQPHPPSMTEQAAAFAVLGCDLDSLGGAVARYWSLGEELQQLIRRQPPQAALRVAAGDTDLLRLTCSLANELVDALGLPEAGRKAAVELVVRRYARALNLTTRDIQLAIHPEPAEADGHAPTAAHSQALARAQADPARPAVAKEPKLSPLRARLAAQDSAAQSAQRVTRAAAGPTEPGPGPDIESSG